MIVIMLIRLYASRVILDVLGIDDYGLYNVIAGMVVMFSFLNNAMTDSSQRFLTFELGRNDIKRLALVFRTSKVIHALVALVLFVILEIFGMWFVNTQMNIPEGRLNACLWVMHLSVVTAMLKIITVPYNAIIIAHERMNVFALISVIEAVLLLLILYFLDVIHYDKLILYGILVLVVQVVITCIYMTYCMMRFDLHKRKTTFDRSLFKEMTGFAGWNVCGNMAQLFSTHGLNMLLNVFFTPAVNAARGIAVTVQGAVGQFSGSFQSALNPQITKSYAMGDNSYLSRLIFFSSKFTFYLLTIVSLPLLLETDFAMHLWLKDVPALSVIFFRLILLTTIIEAVVNPVNVAVAATGNIKWYQTLNGIITISVLPIAYILFQSGYPPVAAFVVQLLLCVISFIVRFYIMRGMIEVSIRDYINDVLINCLVVVVVSALVPLAIHMSLEPSWFRFVSVLVASVVCCLVTMWFLGLNSSERQSVCSYLRT